MRVSARALRAAPARPGAAWIRFLAAVGRPHRTTALLSLLAATAATAATTSAPLIMKAAIDDIAGGPPRALDRSLLLLALCACAGFVFTTARNLWGERLALSLDHDLRVSLFQALSRLDGAGHDRLEAGQVLSRATSDLQLVHRFITLLPQSAGHLLLLLASTAVMLSMSPLLTAVPAATACALWMAVRRSRAQLSPLTAAAQQRAAETADMVAATVAGIRVVKAFGQEHREVGRFERSARLLRTARMRLALANSRCVPPMQAVPAFGQVAALGVGGWLALSGTISLGTLVAFCGYLSQVDTPLWTLSTLATTARQARAGTERITALIDVAPVPDDTGADRAEALPFLPESPALVFDGVTFRYPGQQSGSPALDGVNICLQRGEILGIMGPAGSGKSTLIELALGFHETTAGTIRVFGRDLRLLSRRRLRSAMAAVGEEPFLFSSSIADNIALGRPDATADEIQAAARAARADAFISALPDGYATVLGERGLSLSGGQRQRLALARALLADPPILLLDDTTSAVDLRTESEVQAALRDEAGRRAVLLVARRRSSLRLADRIAVLEHGRVVDLGTHEELSRRCPAYLRLLDAPEGTGQPESSPPGSGYGPGSAHSEDPGGAAVRDHRGRTTERHNTVGPKALRFRFLPFLRPLRLSLIASLVLIALDAAAALAASVILRRGMAEGVTSDVPGVLAGAAVTGTVVIVLRWFVQAREARLSARNAESLLYALRVRMWSGLHGLGTDFFDRQPAGQVTTLMSTDPEALSAFLQSGLAAAVVSLLTCLGALGALAAGDGGAGLVVCAALPVYAASGVLFRRIAAVRYEAARNTMGEVNAFLQEAFAGMRTLQLFRAEERWARLFRTVSTIHRRSALNASACGALYFPFLTLLVQAASVGVLAVGARRVGDGTLAVAGLVACLLYVDLVFTPIQQLAQVFDGFQRAAVAAGRIRSFMEVPATPPQAPAPVPATRLRGEIRFDGVSFTYPARNGTSPSVLTDIRLHIPPGQIVALVGSTGAGKSTITKLLARFHDVTDGAILVDGTDLRDYDLRDYRRCLGIVPQETHLFAGTVRDAIAYGRPEASDHEVVAAARYVGAHDVIIGFPQGYRHRLLGQGRNLSEGQRQLLALARAELVDPDIVLLDEASSALDAATEASAMLRAGRGGGRRRTTIVVAHNLAVAARADRVVVLDQGRVVQDGSHRALLSVAGPYRRMWRAGLATRGGGRTPRRLKPTSSE
ncbi:ABC transporter ATP-binding protein [Streptomyces sp. NPDC058701]|uniref:ABC transporter ATP-binding protein n=1 Tax=Streptomyces sp. NPDC058701 TaxID=3346608 RepID=UPI003647B791